MNLIFGNRYYLLPLSADFSYFRYSYALIKRLKSNYLLIKKPLCKKFDVNPFHPAAMDYSYFSVLCNIFCLIYVPKIKFLKKKSWKLDWKVYMWINWCKCIIMRVTLSIWVCWSVARGDDMEDGILYHSMHKLNLTRGVVGVYECEWLS